MSLLSSGIWIIIPYPTRRPVMHTVRSPRVHKIGTPIQDIHGWLSFDVETRSSTHPTYPMGDSRKEGGRFSEKRSRLPPRSNPIETEYSQLVSCKSLSYPLFLSLSIISAINLRMLWIMSISLPNQPTMYCITFIDFYNRGWQVPLVYCGDREVIPSNFYLCYHTLVSCMASDVS